MKDIAVVAGLLVVESGEGETRTRRCVYNTHLKKDEIIFFVKNFLKKKGMCAQATEYIEKTTPWKEKIQKKKEKNISAKRKPIRV